MSLYCKLLHRLQTLIIKKNILKTKENIKILLQKLGNSNFQHLVHRNTKNKYGQIFITCFCFFILCSDYELRPLSLRCGSASKLWQRSYVIN